MILTRVIYMLDVARYIGSFEKIDEFKEASVGRLSPTWIFVKFITKYGAIRKFTYLDLERAKRQRRRTQLFFKLGSADFPFLIFPRQYYKCRSLSRAASINEFNVLGHIGKAVTGFRIGRFDQLAAHQNCFHLRRCREINANL
jgi:hypothetical protein